MGKLRNPVFILALLGIITACNGVRSVGTGANNSGQGGGAQPSPSPVLGPATCSNPYTVQVTWTLNDPAEQVTSYTIYWGTYAGQYTSSQSVASPGTSLAVQGLPIRQVYHFVATATNQAGQSAYTNEVILDLTQCTPVLKLPGEAPDTIPLKFGPFVH